MTDHSDIEKLPLEIDGVPVREVVREVFRNPENGTPDNISKAGCIALVMQRKEVWNAWRTQFPVVKEFPLQYNNSVNLSSVDFRLDEYKKIEFSDMQFGDGANFDGMQLGDWVRFNGAQFGNLATFIGAQFGDRAKFDGAQFGFLARFNGAQFGFLARFNGAQFGGSASFGGAQFGDGARFDGAQFGEFSNFDGAQFGRNVNFSHARFGNYAKFRARTWEKLTTLYSDRFSTAKEWASSRGLAPDIFLSISFAGCAFEGQVDFSNRQFLDKTSFGCLTEIDQFSAWIEGGSQLMSFKDIPKDERMVRFGEAPVFHGCKLHQDTSFEDAKFPLAKGSEEAARAYRTLKLAFSQQQATREEQRFFKLEMEEEAPRATGIQKWLYWAYKEFSDFGFSVTRPLKYAAFAWLGFTVIYGLLSWLGQCVLATNACQFNPAWLEFSVLQAIPLLGMDKTSDLLRPLVFSTNAYLSVGVTVFVIIHKTLSLAALFLAGLALRNLFKLK